MRTPRYTKLWWVAVSCISLSITTAAIAASGVIEDNDPFKYGFQIAIAIILALVGGYCKAIERRVTGLEKANTDRLAELTKTREMVIGEYATKLETFTHREKVESSLATIHGRLDDIFSMVVKNSNGNNSGNNSNNRDRNDR